MNLHARAVESMLARDVLPIGQSMSTMLRRRVICICHLDPPEGCTDLVTLDVVSDGEGNEVAV